MTQNSFRKHLSMPGMLSEERECFDSIPNLVVSRGITLSGCLMTGLGVFRGLYSSQIDLRSGSEYHNGFKLKDVVSK